MGHEGRCHAVNKRKKAVVDVIKQDQRKSPMHMICSTNQRTRKVTSTPQRGWSTRQWSSGYVLWIDGRRSVSLPRASFWQIELLLLPWSKPGNFVPAYVHHQTVEEATSSSSGSILRTQLPELGKCFLFTILARSMVFFASHLD